MSLECIKEKKKSENQKSYSLQTHMMSVMFYEIESFCITIKRLTEVPSTLVKRSRLRLQLVLMIVEKFLDTLMMSWWESVRVKLCETPG